QRELQIFKDIRDSMDQISVILDIGEGNGILLIELVGFELKFEGVYFCSLCRTSRNVLQTEDLSNVEVKEVDFMSCSGELSSFDLCIDKGAFDTISLNPENTEESKACYVQALRGALKEEGFFVITSCSWTKDQLLQMFSQGERTVGDTPGMF
uniref:Methyltransferase domain-containing protein n=1 Tax=Oncorhynchus tshawytscha TaxID=74940 RepID=A0AAZ3S874_ONCTS